MHRRLQLWLGVSACALLGAAILPAPAFAQMGGGGGGSGGGGGNAQDLDPDGGMEHECGESSGCAEAGESFESKSADEFGDDSDEQPAFIPPAVPRSQGSGGLSSGDSVQGGVNDGGLGE